MSTRQVVSGAELFSASSDQVINYLRRHTPISEWSVSRIAGGEQVHVHSGDNELLHRGRRIPYDDTFCIRMSNGADRVVADAAAHPQYSDLADAGVVRAYAGIPITDEEGRTFGTLCGIDTRPLDDASQVDTDLIELMAELLSSQLTMSRIADRERRSAAIATALANTDALTGLVNRRGWDLLVEDAQTRVTAYGDPVAVAVIDLDGLKTVNDDGGHEAGDELLRRAAAAIAGAAQHGDRVARYGGDEFAVLSNNVAVKDLSAHYARFSKALADVGVPASIGHAATSAGDISVTDAFALADAQMYAAKGSARAV